jgi:hypothetical protein
MKMFVASVTNILRYFAPGGGTQTRNVEDAAAKMFRWQIIPATFSYLTGQRHVG